MKPCIFCVVTSDSFLKGLTAAIRYHDMPFDIRVVSMAELRAPIPSHVVAVVAPISKYEAIGAEAQIKYVNYSGVSCDVIARIPSVIPDEIAITREITDHFSANGHRVWAMLSRTWEYFIQARTKAFKEHAKNSGLTPNIFMLDLKPQTIEARSALKSWLTELPKPCALFAASDDLAIEVLSEIQAIGLRVPDQIALATVATASSVVEAISPVITHIAIPYQRMGQAAGQTLRALLTEGRIPINPIYVPPHPIHIRESTNRLAVQDPVIEQAIQFIRKNIATPLNVEDLVRELNISRTVLQRRFQAVFNNSPLHEIHRLKVDYAKKLLCDTKEKVQLLYRKCGFNNKVRFNAVFKKFVDCTPSVYRTKYVHNEDV